MKLSKYIFSKQLDGWIQLTDEIYEIIPDNVPILNIYEIEDRPIMEWVRTKEQEKAISKLLKGDKNE